jgi:hypothetical protein
MPRPVQRLLAIVTLTVGLTMLVCGGGAFAKAEPPPPLPDEDAHQICPPTIGEMIGIGPVGRKLGCLAVAVVGMAVAGGSLLSLIPKREHI